MIPEVSMGNEKVKLYDNSEKPLTVFTAKNEPVEDLIYEFLKDRGATTERAYRRELKAFFKFTGESFGLPRVYCNKMLFCEVRRVHIIKYKNYLETTLSDRNKPFAPNTINRKLSAVSSFFQFLLQRELIEKNPAEFCKRSSRMVMEETQVFSDREMKTLFDLIIEEAPPLHKASILLLFTTGMRQAELRNLKFSNFQSREGIRFMTYIGKGQ